MKTFLKIFLFVVSLSVFTVTASAHCGSCEGDTPKDEHSQVTEHKKDADHHKADKDAEKKTCTKDKDGHKEKKSHDKDHH